MRVRERGGGETGPEAGANLVDRLQQQVNQRVHGEVRVQPGEEEGVSRVDAAQVLRGRGEGDEVQLRPGAQPPGESGEHRPADLADQEGEDLGTARTGQDVQTDRDRVVEGQHSGEEQDSDPERHQSA